MMARRGRRLPALGDEPRPAHSRLAPAHPLRPGDHVLPRLLRRLRNDPLAHLRFTRTIRDLVPEDEALAVLGQAFVELHERAARRVGKARWADKAPENVLYTSQWEALLEGRWLLVHVVRNPLDTVASMRGRFPLTLPDDVAGQADVYCRYTEAGLAFEAAHPERCFRVVYEELCATLRHPAPAGVARGGLRPGTAGIQRPSAPGGPRGPGGAPNGSVHGYSVGRWPSVLTEDEAALIWARTQELWRTIDPEGRHQTLLPGVSKRDERGTIRGDGEALAGRKWWPRTAAVVVGLSAAATTYPDTAPPQPASKPSKSARLRRPGPGGALTRPRAPSARPTMDNASA